MRREVPAQLFLSPPLLLDSASPPPPMARILSRALLRDPSPYHPRLPFARLVALRGRSDARIIEVDLGAAGDADEAEAVDVVSLRRLENAIHAISVRRCAPDWLPFLPGSSYWVPPPKRAFGVVEVGQKVANPLTEEETMAITTVRGWPSSAYFVEGIGPHSAKRKPKEASAPSDDEE